MNDGGGEHAKGPRVGVHAAIAAVGLFAFAGAYWTFQEETASGAWTLLVSRGFGFVAGVAAAFFLYRADVPSRGIVTIGGFVGGALAGAFALSGLFRVLNGGPPSSVDEGSVPCTATSVYFTTKNTVERYEVRFSCTADDGATFEVEASIESAIEPGNQVHVPARRGRLGVFTARPDALRFDRPTGGVSPPAAAPSDAPRRSAPP